MDHLLTMRATILRIGGSNSNGRPTYSYDPVASDVPCRLDLTFSRPGKDLPPVPQSGRAPDRVGVLYLPAGTDLRPEDRVEVSLAGELVGTFQVAPMPDQAVGFAKVHHLEVQVTEVAQMISGS